MRYKVGGYEIRSELAAKPPSQAASAVKDFLGSYGEVSHAVDYGCGKLRYAGILAHLSEDLTLIDSREQLDRRQQIDGVASTVRELAVSRWPHVRLETVEEFAERTRPTFDLVLCANVFSTIPTDRARRAALHAIRRRLQRTGTLLMVNQHTNSFFSKLATRDDTRPHLDGWLICRDGSASFYGILDKERTERLLHRDGFEILRQWIAGQSNFALARVV